MLYAKVRPSIKSGDLLAWSHRSWATWHDIKIQIVRIFTQSEYCHVGIAWVIGDRVFVIEAVQPLVRIYPLSKLGEFYLLPLTLNWSEEVLEHAISKVGEPYSQLQAVQAFFRLPSEDSLWECAELVISIAKKAGVDLGTIATPSGVVSAALHNSSSITLVEQ